MIVQGLCPIALYVNVGSTYFTLGILPDLVSRPSRTRYAEGQRHVVQVSAPDRSRNNLVKLLVSGYLASPIGFREVWQCSFRSLCAVRPSGGFSGLLGFPLLSGDRGTRGY